MRYGMHIIRHVACHMRTREWGTERSIKTRRDRREESEGEANQGECCWVDRLERRNGRNKSERKNESKGAVRA